jgi:prepilin signal peptidase PulO-like enzyme (type II secretory pathway)
VIARLVVCAVLALPAGWFAGVLADRVPDREPLFRPLKPIDPRGRDLVLHLGVLVLFLAAGWRFHEAPWSVMLAFCALFGVLAALSAIDIEHYRLPDLIVLPSLVASIPIIAVISLVESSSEQIQYALAGGAIYFGFLFVAHLISPRGMGFGDVKLAAVMGLYVGWLGTTFTEALALVLWAMLVGFASGSVFGFVVLLRRRRNRPFPFGPFLAFGTVVAVLASRALVTG